jgi:DNA repair exonuclease SbcCD ATPase subunit
MILKIKSVGISSFRDIADDQKVTFTDSGIYSITGENLDDGGSNGTGKTSFVMAIIAGFLGSKATGVSAKELKNRHTDSKPVIDLEFEVDHQPHSIKRTIGGKVILDGVEGSADDVQDKINNLLKLTPEQFKALSFKEQGDAGGFLLLSDGEKKEFLSSFFNLDEINAANETISKEFNLAEQKLTGSTVSITNREHLLESSRAEVTRTQDKLNSIHDLDQQILSNRIERVELIRKNEDLAKLLEGGISPSIGIINAELVKIKQAVINAEAELAKNAKIDSELHIINEKTKSLNKQIATVHAHRCTTCDQEINAEKTASLMKSLQLELGNNITAFQALKAKRIDEQSIKQSILALKAIQEKHNNNLMEERLKNDKTCVKQAIATNEKLIQNLDTMIASAKREQEHAKADFDRATKSLEHNQNELARLKAENEKMQSDIKVLESLDKVLSKNGFVGYIFDTVLEELNYETNANLSNIPNASKFTLQFHSDKIAKSTGNVTKNITFKLFSNGDEVSIDSLSGGEKRSLIIAVDEALDSVLSKRTGTVLNWKFLDEPFDSIDINSKEALLEFYKGKSHDRLYFIIDHTSELNAGLDNSIKLTKKNGIAHIS